MDASLDILNKILESLYCRYTKSCGFEELARLVFPVSNPWHAPAERILIERKNQAAVLEALLMLHDEGLVFFKS